MIAELTEAMIQPDAEYHHKWEKGDIVIWDNRFSTSHRAAGDDPPEEDRIHWRVSINDYGAEARRGGGVSVDDACTVTPFRRHRRLRRRYLAASIIREPLAAADRDAIRRAWLDNLVLRFRDQPLTDAQHMAFTRQFGELEFNPAKLIEKQYGVETQTSGRRSEIPPEISVISNILENGKPIGGLGDGEAFWHTIHRLSMCRRPRACCAVSDVRRPRPAARPIFSICTRPTRPCPKYQESGSTE